MRHSRTSPENMTFAGSNQTRKTAHCVIPSVRNIQNGNQEAQKGDSWLLRVAAGERERQG